MGTQQRFYEDSPVPRLANATRTTIVRTACGLVLAGVALLTALNLAACRTTEGAGRDIQALGDNIADSADKHKP